MAVEASQRFMKLRSIFGRTQSFCHLAEYEKLATKLGPNEEDRKLIAQARFHIPTSRRYLSHHHRYPNCEAFLEAGAQSRV